MNTIDRFEGEYFYLSNFYETPVHIDGLTYLSAEAAFQAYKCIDPEMRKQFTALPPAKAKRLGRQVSLRSDWEEIKISVMTRVVKAKFEQNPLLAHALLRTGDAVLIEGTTWHDTFWGIDLNTGKGRNELGKILMALRSEYQENGISGSKSYD